MEIKKNAFAGCGKAVCTGFGLLWKLVLAVAAAYGAAFLFSESEPSLLSACVFALALFLQFAGERDRRPDARVRAVAACVAAFFALCLILYRYNQLGTGGSFFSLRTLGLLFGSFALLYVPLTAVYARWAGVSAATDAPSRAALKRLYWISFGVMLLAWLPMYLMYFPGRVCYDSTVQMDEIVNHILRNHHPFLHTQVMKAVLGLGKAIFGTPNGGVAVYCVVQMLCFALLFAYTVVTMRAFGAKRWFCILALLFFALEPNVMYRSQVIEKDGTFSLMVLLFLVTLWRLIVFTRRGEPLKAHIRDFVLLCVGALGFCTMRTNGFFTFVPMTVVLLFALDKRLRAVKFACIGASALTMLYLAVVIPTAGITNPDTIEALSMPLQNVSRVLHDGGDVTDDEKALLSHIFTVDRAAESYTSYTSDTMKTLVRETGDQAYLREHAAEYLRLWLRVGLRNPRLYLYSWIDECCGYWAPEYISPRVHYNDTGDMKDYLTDNSYGYYADPVLPDGGIRLVQWWMVNAKTIPALAMLSNIGSVTWLAVLALGAAVVRRQRHSLLLHLPFVLLFLVLMVTTPYNVEYRYLYPLLIALPMLYAVSLYGEGVPAEAAAKR